jgi:hypothetical protein
MKRETKAQESTLEMRRLLSKIENKLPDVAAVAPDLVALRLLLNVQLHEATLLTSSLTKRMNRNANHNITKM